jgi:predicted deacetylase
MASSCQYLVRFDDICSTMNWSAWSEIEACLKAYDVRPILAVVPRNRDRKLIVDSPRAEFWDRVREWQALGWTIALHGYEHRMVSTDGGVLGISRKSEFSGTAVERQREKIRRGLRILRDHGVKVETWVAPWHSFDEQTLDVLMEEKIRYVSDGLATRPWRDARGLIWIPQQLWRFRRMPLGVWTVCHHHNSWSREDIRQFSVTIRKYRSRITSLDSVTDQPVDERGISGAYMRALVSAAVRMRLAAKHEPSAEEPDDRFMESDVD